MTIYPNLITYFVVSWPVKKVSYQHNKYDLLWQLVFIIKYYIYVTRWILWHLYDKKVCHLSSIANHFLWRFVAFRHKINDNIVLSYFLYDIRVPSLINAKLSQIIGPYGATWTSFVINPFMVLIRIWHGKTLWHFIIWHGMVL